MDRDVDVSDCLWIGRERFLTKRCMPSGCRHVRDGRRDGKLFTSKALRGFGIRAMSMGAAMNAAAEPTPNDPQARSQPESGARRRIALYTRPDRDVGLWLLLFGAGVILLTAFALRDAHRLVPERGAGYGLGIVGLGAMSALLGYSVRKRLRFARRWGPVQRWFRVHMFLGIAGPVAILLHCNFRLGSTNANVALASALAVSASGVFGRMLYGRIHAGLFGRRLSLMELREAVAASKARVDAEDASARGLDLEPLDRFARAALDRRGPLLSTIRLLALPWRRRRARRDALAGLGGAAPDETLERLNAYLEAVARASAFTACERLFALWHVLHLPLCVVLFLAAAVHVAAVHVY
jgi:hypothetical protein